MRIEAKRGLLVFVVCGLPLALFWVPGVPLVYVLSAQFVMFIVVGKLAFQLWPDGIELSVAMHRLAWAMAWGFPLAAVFIVLPRWKAGEYIVMPIPTIALLLAFPRTRRWLSDKLQRLKARA